MSSVTTAATTELPVTTEVTAAAEASEVFPIVRVSHDIAFDELSNEVEFVRIRVVEGPDGPSTSMYMSPAAAQLLQVRLAECLNAKG